jgi:hypothetical protein
MPCHLSCMSRVLDVSCASCARVRPVRRVYHFTHVCVVRGVSAVPGGAPSTRARSASPSPVSAGSTPSSAPAGPTAGAEEARCVQALFTHHTFKREGSGPSTRNLHVLLALTFMTFPLVVFGVLPFGFLVVFWKPNRSSFTFTCSLHDIPVRDFMG